MPPLPQPHECALPHTKGGGYGGTGYPEGAIFICDDCDTDYVCVPSYETLGPVSKWRKVRWWHWRLRKQVELIKADSMWRSEIKLKVVE
jgi:hypothetical protein